MRSVCVVLCSLLIAKLVVAEPATTPVVEPIVAPSVVPPVALPSGTTETLTPADAINPYLTAAKPKHEHPERALVRIRRQGQLKGAGVVLSNGRVLTALSGIGTGRDLSVVFADGAIAPLRVLRTHRGYDLALLVAETATPRLGLELSSAAELTSALLWRPGGERKVAFQGADELTALGADDVELPGVRSSAQRWPLGTPVVDRDGRLSALTISACVPAGTAAPCKEKDVALPARVIGKFLETSEGDVEAWLGVGVEVVDAGWVRGLRVVAIEPGSPAQSAGLESEQPAAEGDLLVALNGTPIGTPRRLQQLVAALLPGTEVDLLLVRAGLFQHVTVKLGSALPSRKAWQLSPPLIQPPSPWPGF